jgi:hypothetical protein
MAKCVQISRKHRKLCAGDLDKEIQILERDMVAPLAGEVDYDITFDTDTAPVIYASVETPRGRAIFDGTGTQVDVTHQFGVYFDTTYSVEDFVLMEGRYFRILDVQDLEERHEWIILSCSERGTEDNPANKA